MVLSLCPGLSEIAPIGLERVEQVAALTTRIDRKYLVQPDRLSGVIESMAGGLQALEIGGARSFRYESVYFDTPDRESYLMTARARPRRYKLRTRSYLDDGSSWFEVKERRRDGMTAKTRLQHPFDHRGRLDDAAWDLIESIGPIGGWSGRLAPALTVTYRRTTLVDEGDAARITLDSSVEASDPAGRIARVGDLVLVETKTTGHATGFDRRLWRLGVRPVSISKFATLLAVLDPCLHSNRWSRVRRLYLPPAS